jgi:tetratricopeptide (TPR) repeat protein
MTGLAIEGLLRWARQQHAGGRLDSAEAAYRKVLSTRPDHDLAAHMLGLLLAQRGLKQEAVEWFRRAVELSPQTAPQTPWYYLNLGRGLMHLKQNEEAVKALQRATELKPDYPQALNSLGIAYEQLGMIDEAIAIFDRVIRIQPDFREAQANLSLAWRTKVRVTGLKWVKPDRR